MQQSDVLPPNCSALAIDNVGPLGPTLPRTLKLGPRKPKK